MTGKGVVIKSDGDVAVVRIRKSSACGHDCGECRVCTNPQIEVEAENQIGAEVGDTVILGVPTGQILLAAFLVYVAPVFGIMLIYMLLDTFFKNPFVIASCCILWVTLWLSLIRIQNSKQKDRKSVILEVADEEN